MRLIGLMLALALTLAPLAAEAQQATKVYRIGFLGMSSATDYAGNLEAFRQGLRSLGYEEGRNILIDYRWAQGRVERLPGLAAELARLGPDVLVTHAGGIGAAQQATRTIPIVMGVSADPVGQGLVKSLANPGGNTTGVSSQITDLSAKRLEVLKEVVPKLRLVAVLSFQDLSGAREALRETEVAANQMGGIRVRSFAMVTAPTEMEAVFATILRDRPDGLIVLPDPRMRPHNARIVQFSAKNRLPAVYGSREFVDVGGLVSYAGDFREGWRVAARYVDKILKGAKPADLPIEQPTKFELIINRKTAEALGLTIPSSILGRADEVIQ
ncbi:MAG TPA: ABC transporter substrate-binding protein [Methylomirabilota bacterium]